MGIGLILLIVAVVLAVLLIGIYNRLVALRQNCNQAFADIDVQLKQRHDLIPNLVETVKGYAAHEKGTLEAVIQARNAAVNAEKTGDPKAMGAAEGVLGAALGRLIALSEAYPDLKANTNFQQLQNELSDIENKLAAASSTAPWASTTPGASNSRRCCSPGRSALGRAISSMSASKAAPAWTRLRLR
jgi:LemA protein